MVRFGYNFHFYIKEEFIYTYKKLFIKTHKNPIDQFQKNWRWLTILYSEKKKILALVMDFSLDIF